MSLLSSISFQEQLKARRSFFHLKMSSARDQCLDLSVEGEKFLIVYYEGSDPGSEYEIVSQKDLVNDGVVLQPHSKVEVKFGKAKAQGVVVVVADHYNYLKDNFNRLTQIFQEALEVKVEENQVVHVVEVPPPAVLPNKRTPADRSPEYLELKKKYDNLKKEYLKLTTFVKDLKGDLSGTLKKIDVAFPLLKDGDESRVLQPANNQNTEGNGNFNEMIPIGAGGTKVPRRVYDCIDWNLPSAATRKLLIELFPRRVLATHSLTGKPSPAFLGTNKETKMRLNSTIVSDIVDIVSSKCRVTPSAVRSAITTKCADENKLYRKRIANRRGSGGSDEENEERGKKRGQKRD